MTTDAEQGLALIKALVSPHTTCDRDAPGPWRPCAACRASQIAVTPHGQALLRALIAILPEALRETAAAGRDT